MRLSHPLTLSPWFVFSSAAELIAALGTYPSDDEKLEIERLSALSLIPASSVETLATMLGINPGLIWSFIHNPNIHYRTFSIKSGRKIRVIDAPKVALKTVQTWFANNLAKSFSPDEHVFGFVKNRSHIMAAQAHQAAKWALSFDIKSFFQTTPYSTVITHLQRAGYSLQSATIIAGLTCKDGYLAQGAPSSPVLSNMCFRDVDVNLAMLAKSHSCRVTRYADDVTFSGFGTQPIGLREEVHGLFNHGPWNLSPEKERAQPIKGRIKIHGLLVKNDGIRLTKGYRNKIRAYNHILKNRKSGIPNTNVLVGHVQYARQIDNLNKDTINKINRAVHPSTVIEKFDADQTQPERK